MSEVDFKRISLGFHNLKSFCHTLLLFSCEVVSDSFVIMDCGLPGSSVHGIFQARILEGTAISSSRRSSDPQMEPTSPSLVGEFFITEPPGKPFCHMIGSFIENHLKCHGRRKGEMNDLTLTVEYHGSDQTGVFSMQSSNTRGQGMKDFAYECVPYCSPS